MSEIDNQFEQSNEGEVERESWRETEAADIEVPETTTGWLERLKNVDYQDHLGTIALVGGAALALGVGVYELKKHGKKINIGFADRRFKDKNVISIVEKTEKGGLAFGAATTFAALQALGKTKDVFAMEDGNVAYPLEHDEDKPVAAKRARKIVSWLSELHAERANKGSE